MLGSADEFRVLHRAKELISENMKELEIPHKIQKGKIKSQALEEVEAVLD